MEEERKDGTIEINKSTLWMIVSIFLGILLVISLFTEGFGIGKDDGPTGFVAQPSPSPAAAPAGIPTGIINVNAAELVDDDPFIGNKNAELTIVEWSDFQCPFCARFREQTFDAIKKDYIDTGKVKFVYRDFPLSFHENAENSAIAAECADEQGKFWEYHDRLFKNQQALDVASLKKYAGELKLDSGKFDKCLDSGKYKDEVNKDLADGSQAGIDGTPGFIIGSRQLSGAQPYASFKAAIDAELSK